MSSSAIHFFNEDLEFSPRHPEGLRTWILETADYEGFEIDEINYIFCSDSHLLTINQQYLEHDTFTDIITFPFSEEEKVITGDVYISIDRVWENSEKFGVEFEDELHRVIIHGILHLLGYVDDSDEDKKFMRQKEDHYLAKLSLS